MCLMAIALGFSKVVATIQVWHPVSQFLVLAKFGVCGEFALSSLVGIVDH